jgi:hypothetical protein
VAVVIVVLLATDTVDLSGVRSTLSGVQAPDPGDAPASEQSAGDDDDALYSIDEGDSAAAGPLVPEGATWKYLDDGSDQGTAWYALSYDDSAWPSGPAPLGYGDGDEATVVGYGPDQEQKFVTTYFRNTFQVEDPGACDSMHLRVLHDDGAVVYLNGAEVFRNNMPDGMVEHSTLAPTRFAGEDERIYRGAIVPPTYLRVGRNIIGVEIHQSDPTSSDISFDLKLSRGSCR